MTVIQFLPKNIACHGRMTVRLRQSRIFTITAKKVLKKIYVEGNKERL